MALSLAGPESGRLVEALTKIPQGEWKFLDAKTVMDQKNHITLNYF